MERLGRGDEPDASHSRASSLSCMSGRSGFSRKSAGSSNSSASRARARQGMSAADIGLHDRLQEAEQKLSSDPGTSQSESTSSENRDRLKDSEKTDVMADRSDAVSGERVASGSDCTNPSHSRSQSSDELMSSTSQSLTIEELQDRVETLKGTLTERDDQQSVLLNKLVTMKDNSNESLEGLTAKLRDAKKDQRAAEDARDETNMKAAGTQARQDANINRLTEQKSEMELEMEEQRDAIDKAAADDRKKQEKQEADEKHNQRLHEHNKEVHAQLRDELQSLTREIRLQKSADAKGSSSQNYDSDQADEKERLRAELQNMLAAKQRDREQMTTMRLEMLGLNRSKEFSRLDSREHISDSGTPPGSRTSPNLGKGKSSHGRSAKGKSGVGIGVNKGRGTGRGALDSIDEEEDDDLPSLQDAAWASDCVSSDAGDSVDDRSLDDDRHTWQTDLLHRIQKELAAERKQKETLQDDIAGQKAEHALETKLLHERAEVRAEMHEAQVVEAEQQKIQASRESTRDTREIDKLQVSLRSMGDSLTKQNAQLAKQATDEEQRKADQAQLEEKLNLSNEQLRLAGLRLKDAKQQQMHDAAQQRREMTNLKLKLAVERCQPGSSHDQGTGDTTSGEAHFRQMAEGLQQERNILISKLEAKEVNFRVQLEELEMQHNAKIKEIQKGFDSKLEDLRQDKLRSAWESVVSAQAISSNQSIASPIASTSCLSSPLQRSGDDAPVLQTGLQSMIWSVLGLVPNLAILLCSFEGFIVRQFSEKASALLDMQIGGQILINFLRESSSATSLKRSVLMNQSMADNLGAHTPGFAAHELGRYELCTARGRQVTAGISVAHLPAGPSTGEEKSLLFIFSEDAEAAGPRSAASSDICPSDSASVCKQKDNKWSQETRRNLRASFFSSRQSAVSSASSADP